MPVTIHILWEKENKINYSRRTSWTVTNHTVFAEQYYSELTVNIFFMFLFRDDQPPWYHSSWPELHPSEMDTHQLITYLMENVIKYRSRIPAAVQDGSLSLLLINALKIPHLIKQNLEFVKRM